MADQPQFIRVNFLELPSTIEAIENLGNNRINVYYASGIIKEFKDSEAEENRLFKCKLEKQSECGAKIIFKKDDTENLIVVEEEVHSTDCLSKVVGDFLLTVKEKDLNLSISIERRSNRTKEKLRSDQRKGVKCDHCGESFEEAENCLNLLKKVNLHFSCCLDFYMKQKDNQKKRIFDNTTEVENLTFSVSELKRMVSKLKK